MSLEIWLIRHAESVPPGPGLEDEFTRPLSLRGEQEARELAAELPCPTAIYSSPYLRALQTVQPLADLHGMTISVVHDFREHMMSPYPIPHWREVLSLQWVDFWHREEGGETMRETQMRGREVLESISLKHPTGRVYLAGHGTIISLLLHLCVPTIGFEFHLAMPNPAVYRLVRHENRWVWARD